MARKARVGSGGRFNALVAELSARKGVTNPAALAAWIGRRKYGAAAYSRMSSHGRSRRRGKK